MSEQIPRYKIAFEDIEKNYYKNHPEENAPLNNNSDASFFEILGLNDDATVEQIEEAYTNLSDFIEIAPDYAGNKKYMLESLEKTHDYLMDDILREHYRTLLKSKKEAHAQYTIYRKRNEVLQNEIRTNSDKNKKSIIMSIIITSVLVFLLTYGFAINKASASTGNLKNQQLNKKVYVTSTGIRYHKKNCLTIQDSNTAEVTVKTAIKNGRTPCSVCTPDK